MSYGERLAAHAIPHDELGGRELLDRVDILVIDAEGAEEQILGSPDDLPRPRPRLILFEHEHLKMKTQKLIDRSTIA